METFISSTIKKAGAKTRQLFGKVGVKYTKSDENDMVTEADLASNKIITNAIKSKFPDHGIISEETGTLRPKADHQWIIDPIDGTRNFATGTPLFTLMICLAVKGEVRYAACYNPVTKELVYAEKGRGVFLNGKRVRGSATKKWNRAWGIIGSCMTPFRAKLFGKLYRYLEKFPCWVGNYGSIGLNSIYLATGRRDWLLTHGAGIWDYAPTSLILQESGYIVTNLKGKPWTLQDREMLAANKYLHPILLKAII